MNKRTVSFVAAALAVVGFAQVAHAQASPSPYTSATRYDARGQVTGTISPNDPTRGYSSHLATRTSYDAAGRPIKVESGYLTSWQSEAVAPLNWPVWTGTTGFRIETTVETVYDAIGRKTKQWVKGSDGDIYSLTQYSYDSYGRLECTAVRMNPAVYGSLPSACTLGTEGSQGPDRITKTVYDGAGQVLQIREGFSTSIEAAEVTYTYTSNGKIDTLTDAEGNKTDYTYDGHDRLAQTNFPSPTTDGVSSSTDYEALGYDANGNITSRRGRNGWTINYTYDGLNRNTVKVVPDPSGLPSWSTRDVYYSYDLRGLMTSARFDSTSGEGVVIGYDGFGRKSSETLAMGGVSRALASQYDANSNRIRLTWPDGNYVNYGSDVLNRLYYTDNGVIPLFYTPFDAAGRLAVVYRWKPSTANWGHGTGFSFDPASRLAMHWFSFILGNYDALTTLTYNPANQIASVTRTPDAYAFPGYANVNRGYTANGLNQYSAVAGTSFSYDQAGNLISDGVTSFAYDVENRMIMKNSGAVVLFYDPLGRLRQVSASGFLDRQFLYDGDALVAEYDVNGNLLRSYVHGTSDGDDPLVWFEGSGVSNAAPRYLYADERGSIVAITDSGGNLTNVNRYDEYGIPASINAGTFQYTGQVWLPELGMYHYKARMYSPTLGRFMQTDPIGYEDQFNLYTYVGNDPVNGVDPTGKRIEVRAHEVAAGRYHMKIVVIPDDQKSVAGTDGYQQNGDGEWYRTIGAGPDASLNLEVAFNRDNDVAQYDAGNDILVANITPGKGDTENNLISRMYGVAESYDNKDNYGFANGADLGGDPNSNSFVTGFLERLGGDTSGIQNGNVNTPGARDPMNPQEFCNPGTTGCKAP